MTLEERLSLIPELSFITSPTVYEFAIHCVGNFPEYFFHVPASSSGKYHPEYALGEGGLLRHTRAGMNMLRFMIENDFACWYQTDSVYGLHDAAMFDACYIALLCHDCQKSGAVTDPSDPNPPVEHTVFEHPLLASQFLKNAFCSFNHSNNLPADSILPGVVACACACVECHMGKWNASKYSSLILPSPASADWPARLVHMCDYLASRKDLIYDFSKQEIRHE